nr:YciI family protein [Bhargavaea cecembensis]
MKDEELSAKYRPDHLAYLDARMAEGKVRAKGRFTDGSGGLVIYQAETEEDVEELVKHDPYIVQGARTYEIRQWDAEFAE